MGFILPIHPGKTLRETHMVSRGYTTSTLAKDLGVDVKELDLIINEKADITEDISKRLSKVFGSSDGFWLRLQKRYESNLEMKEKGISPPKPIVKSFKNKREALLTAMVAGGNEVYGSAWIHKVIFSLDRINKMKSRKHMFKFKNDDFGISCPEIYSVLDESERNNCIRVVSAKGHNQYEIQEKGRRIGGKCFDRLHPDVADFLKKTAEWAFDCSFNDLVGTYYSMYPETATVSKFNPKKLTESRGQCLVFNRILHRRRELYDNMTDELVKAFTVENPYAEEISIARENAIASKKFIARGMPADSVKWLRGDTLRKMHSSFNSKSNVDSKRLNQVLAAVKEEFASNDCNPDAFDVSVSYLTGILQNRPFESDNKKMAIACCELFLALNGFGDILALDNDLIDIIADAAIDKVDKVRIAELIREEFE